MLGCTPKFRQYNNQTVLSDLLERYSVSVPPVTNNIYRTRSAVPPPNYLPERRSAAFRHHYTALITRRCGLSDLFDLFYEIVQNLLDCFFPLRTITMSDKDPYYMTPQIKMMLRKKNKLLRKGRIEEANALTKRISQSISVQCRCTLNNVSKGGNTVLKKACAHSVLFCIYYC